MRIASRLAICVILLTACAGEPPSAATSSDPTAPGTPSERAPEATTTAGATAPQASGTVRLLFVGDVMLGRRVEAVALAEGADLLRDARFVLSSADFTAGNLESPLTGRPHVVDNPNELEADPSLARVLAAAGFDVLSVANNHAGDAGPEGVADSIDALVGADLQPVGAGTSRVHAQTPVVAEHNGVRVAFLAFDATGLGLAATDSDPGVAVYGPAAAREAVELAGAAADIVAVSVHGGVEYLLDRDPLLDAISADLVSWGADVVWGHGSHVPQPVSIMPSPGGGIAVVATSLGNFLFDQQRPATQVGLVLEVMVGGDGVVAYRVGHAAHDDLRVRFTEWDVPAGPATLIDGEWWSLLALAPQPPGTPIADVPGFAMGDVTVAAEGDVTGDGNLDLVVSYRHPFRSNPVNQLLPDRVWADAAGRSAHLGVFDPTTLDPIWAAGTMLRPVAALAVCDGSVALAFDSLDAGEIVAVGAWVWSDFGFAAPDELLGRGTPACRDVDRDGALDPVILDR